MIENVQCFDAYTYDAYGNQLDNSGSTVNAYGYRGEQYDDELDAYYLRARYYQPGSGRFLTTDPVEGFPTTPMSLHRYVYGYDSPINYVDPSGNLTLNESLVVAAEVSFLSMLTLSAIESSGAAHPYSWLAQNVLPEAYIVGINAIGKIPPPLSIYLSIIFPDNLVPPFILLPFTAAFGGVGLELLLSVGSGEAACFFTTSYGVEAAFLPNASLGFELYDGFVFNLWNANDYNGPFQSLSLTLGFERAGGGWSLFWDADRSFSGPWGGTSTFFSRSLKAHLGEALGVSKANTSYTMLGEPDQSFSRSDVVGSIVTILLATKFIEAIDKGGNVTPLAYWLFETSIWVHTGLAHHYWNLKEPQHNMEMRRTIPRDRVPEFHSGPPIWRLPL